MKVKNNVFILITLILIIAIVIITTLVTIVILSFKIHTLIGILIVCIIIYYICRKLLFII